MKIIHYKTTTGADVYQDWVDGLRDARAKVDADIERAVAFRADFLRRMEENEYG